MFSGCTSLTKAPELPAKSLDSGCYAYMFEGCTSLVGVPEILPATTLRDRCYQGMFYGCTALTEAPKLPALILSVGSYAYMFNRCAKLNYVKALFTDKSAGSCTEGWLDGVSSSGTFVKNAAATWNVVGASGVPEGWTV